MPTCLPTVDKHGKEAVDNILTSHGGSRKFLNVKEPPVNFDADGGPTGGVVPKAADPKGTTDVPKQPTLL